MAARWWSVLSGKERTMSSPTRSASEGTSPTRSASEGTAAGTNPAPRVKAKVLVVDDHALVRRGLSTLIGSEPDLEVCGEAADPAEALTRLHAHQPDLMIVDLSLQNGHGLDLIRQVRARDERVRVLLLAMHGESPFAERA